MNKILREDPNSMVGVADMFGGITGNVVSAKESRDLSLWRDSNGNPTHNQQKEFFAQYFSAGMRKDDDALANQNHYFPSGSAVLGDIINDMENRIGGAQ